MAVRIPVYQRSVQLDAASHTIPRISDRGEVGRAIEGIGNATMQVATHWQAKQDSFDKMQMGQNVNVLRSTIQQIIYEEGNKLDPSRDRPGTLHDRIMARVGPAIAQFQQNAPPSLVRDYAAHAVATSAEASNTAANGESRQRNEYGKRLLDGVSAQIAASVERNPDSGFTGVTQMKKAIADYSAAAGFTTAQAKAYEEGYLRQIGSAAAKGFAQQGRTEEGKAFTDQFVKDRNAENPAPVTPPGPQSSNDGDNNKLNASRIAEIDRNPTAKAAIEKAAAATGLDPNMLKVFASIESGGNPNQDSPTGKHKGLFQLGNAEFGMNNGGGGDIHSADDNAMAAAKILVQRKNDLTQSLGREPTPSELYAGHQQGLGGALAHINNPDQPAWQSMRSTGEGQQIAAKQGPAAADAWAKSAVAGNVPKDVVDRLFNGDPTTITSKEFMAYQSTRVRGGDVDSAVANARIQPSPTPQRTVVASADGTVVNDGRPPAYVGGMNVGGPPQDPNVLPGTKIAYQPGQTFGRTATANAQPFTAIVSHYTGGDSLNSALQTAKGDAGRGGVPYGYHFVVDKDGTVYQTAPLDARTNHVQGWPVGGRTSRPDINNNNAIGVSFVGTDKPTQQQLDASHRLIAGLQTKYSIPNANVVGHGEIQAGSRDPNEGMDVVNQVRSGAPVPPGGPVQVAQAGGTPAMPGTRWDQWGVTTNNTLDGSQMKNASIAKAMTVSLAGRVKADITSTQLNGKGIALPKELQDYYQTPSGELSYDLIANKLGTGAAVQWQQDKDFAQKVYNGGAHMEDMPRGVILQRLQDLNPDPASPYFNDQVKVYNEVLKKAKTIDEQRNADPAGFADKDPTVAALLDASNKDPTNPDKIQALITARMNRQEQIGIPETLRTPLSVAQARLLAAPLLDRARPDRNSAPTDVANGIVKYIGSTSVPGYDDLAHRALQTVLQTKKITDEQAAATADALVQAQHPPPTPLIATKVKPQNYDLSFMAKNGYYVGTSEGMDPYREQGPSDNYADPPDQGFVPGTRFIPADHIKMLKQDPTLSDIFDNGDGDKFPGYGAGAAAYFLKDGKNTYVQSPERGGPASVPADALNAPVGAVTKYPEELVAPEQEPQQAEQPPADTSQEAP